MSLSSLCSQLLKAPWHWFSIYSRLQIKPHEEFPASTWNVEKGNEYCFHLNNKKYPASRASPWGGRAGGRPRWQMRSPRLRPRGWWRHDLREDHSQGNPSQNHFWGWPVSCFPWHFPSSTNSFSGDTQETYIPDFCSRRWWWKSSWTFNDCWQEMCCWSGPEEGISNGGEWRFRWGTVCLSCSSPCSWRSADELASWLSVF